MKCENCDNHPWKEKRGGRFLIAAGSGLRCSPCAWNLEIVTTKPSKKKKAKLSDYGSGTLYCCRYQECGAKEFFKREDSSDLFSTSKRNVHYISQILRGSRGQTWNKVLMVNRVHTSCRIHSPGVLSEM